jgi:3-hydroxybutyrate dehydrogenase
MTSILIAHGTRGVGLGIARAFAAMPNVNITLHHSEDVPAVEVANALDTVRRVMKSSGRALSAPADMTSSSSVDALVAETQRNFSGRLDVVVCNTSSAVEPNLTLAEKITDAEWNAVLQRHLTATFYLSRAALPAMRERHFGRIMNVVTTDALTGRVQAAAFAAAKHGVIGLTKSMALEVAHEGVTVNAVCPGLVAGSDLDARVAARVNVTGETAEEAQAELVQEHMPTGRLVDLDEIGAACVFLALPTSKSINGTVLTLDAGFSVQ